MIEQTTCPDCGGPMRSRTNQKTGQKFWGCQRYPDCRGTRNTDGEAPYAKPERDRDDGRSEDADLPSNRMRDRDRRRW